MTAHELTCPECGEPVPDHGVSGATGIGDRQGNIHFQPAKQHQVCPSCKTALERSVDPPSDAPELGQWRRASFQPDV